MKIDIHTHILPEKWPDLRERYGYGDWVQLDHSCEGRCANMMKGGNFFRKVDPNCWALEDRLREMDATGVDAKPADTLDLCELLNNDLAKSVARYPSRFVGLGTLPMQAPELAIKELIRCKKELGFPGVQIGSHVNDWNLDAEELRPVFAAAEEHGVAIFVHPWDMEMGGRMSKYWLPWLVGGAFPFTVGRIEHGYNVRPDLCAVDCKTSPRNFLGKFYTDALVHDPRALELLVDVIGQDRVICGSDYPFPLGEHHPGLGIEQSKKLLYKNACEFLGLDPAAYSRDT
ncbi:ACMSD-like protein [Mya arenaria]|uniref:2-amino-3-carboxymuconate-6-semialdehyde decarboxylase n=1 Tax=Mya arenaria TaxID=6604 RepID=A0ABY7DEI4_MYAAR|nr:ACMSD-like protein [Mya arenaria]